MRRYISTKELNGQVITIDRVLARDTGVLCYGTLENGEAFKHECGLSSRAGQVIRTLTLPASVRLTKRAQFVDIELM